MPVCVYLWSNNCADRALGLPLAAAILPSSTSGCHSPRQGATSVPPVEWMSWSTLAHPEAWRVLRSTEA